MFKIIVIIVGISVVGLLLYAASRPDRFHIERSTHMAATSEAIYPYLSDFHKNQLWSPYEKKDPAMQRTFSGAESGKGSIYEFAGNREVGKGRLEIVETQAPTRVVLTLDMLEPIQGHNLVTYSIRPDGNGSEVSWAMDGDCGFVGKLMGIFFNMDKMIGKDFSTGLADLKALVEKG
jgi:Polyketide cyclase / dehydrase and lipid transport